MQTQGNARRVRVKGKPGIYVRPGTKPPVYEIGYRSRSRAWSGEARKHREGSRSPG